MDREMVFIAEQFKDGKITVWQFRDKLRERLLMVDARNLEHMMICLLEYKRV